MIFFRFLGWLVSHSLPARQPVSESPVMMQYKTFSAVSCASGCISRRKADEVEVWGGGAGKTEGSTNALQPIELTSNLFVRQNSFADFSGSFPPCSILNYTAGGGVTFYKTE